MTNTIQEYATERGITHLAHFTRACNLETILQLGLVPRDTLKKTDFAHFNDQYRLDDTNAVCLSIGFPNYKMFYGLRKNHPNVDWVVLSICPSALWMLCCAFCVANAASSEITRTPLEQRCNLAALQSMYADCDNKTRSSLNLPNHYPTNPQAEVLMLNGVPKNYIVGAFVENEQMKQKLQDQHPQFDVKVDTDYYSARRDYEHWKKEN